VRRAVGFALVAALGGSAHAGGTQRPNGISARGVSMGGAWTALADDATAIYFNPGALDAIDPHVMIGAEYIIGPRKYTPLLPDGTSGEPESTTIASPAPTLGVVARLSSGDEPSRVTFGLGAWNTFGGRVSYEKTGMPALDVTQDLCFEINAGASLHVSDRLSFGGAVRFGLGFFHVETTRRPFDSDLSASGVGMGTTLGALFRPSDAVRIGVTWRSPLRIATTGRGTVAVSGNPTTYDVSHDQNWPQQASLGVGWLASEQLKLAAQLDWSQWSQLDTIEVVFPSGALPNQIYPEYWRDTWSVRLGGEYALSPSLQLRAGTYYDTPAVPDRTLERQYSDAHKFGVSLGGGFRAAGWRFDFAADGLIPRNRHVADNTDDVMGVSALQNKAPGDYIGSLITFELAAARHF
jgi:long-chain fatty acid transport protein